jgi:hypothetical protein
MESNDEISLFTGGVIETITDNHYSEIESIKNKYENQIKRIKGLQDGIIKKLNEQHEKQVEDINTRHLVTLQNTRIEFENSCQREINQLRNENRNLKESLSIKDVNIKKLEKQVKTFHPYESKYRRTLKELENTQAFEKTLRKELDRAMNKGRQAWDIFKQNCPEEYFRYTNQSQYNKTSFIHPKNYIPETQKFDMSCNVWSGKLLLDNHQNTNENIQFGNF